MNRAAFAIVSSDTNVAARRGAIELRVEDRLLALAAPIRTMSMAMVAVTAGSLALHAILMAAALVVARAPLAVPPQHEIAVEIVQETPKSATPPKPVPSPEPPAQTKAAAAEQTPPKPAPPSKPAAPEKSAVAPQAQPDDAQLKAMRDELASLRAEQAALNAQRQGVLDQPASSQGASGQEASGKAVALPSIGTGDDDAIGYQQLVFSQLAKAKGDSAYDGQAGTTGVRFEMDEAGKLLRVEITRPSGIAALDAQALDIIHRAAPFPPPPTTADRIVSANVNFVPPKPR